MISPPVREVIRHHGPDATQYEERIANMAEGNPGALTAMCRMVVSEDDGSDLLNILAEEGIVGSEIWVGFNDHCNGDEALFAEKIRDRDEAMYEEIQQYRELRGDADG